MAIQTSFLLGGVVWGNIGWDVLRQLRERDAYKHFTHYLFSSTPIWLIALIVASFIFIDIVNISQGRFSWKFSQVLSIQFWILLAFILAMLPLRKRRAAQLTFEAS